MIRYIVPSVDPQLKLERYCPHCNRSGGNIHSGIQHRAISDIKVTVIAQRRMKCPFCGTTWTIRAKGIGHGRQRSDRTNSATERIIGLDYKIRIKTMRGSKNDDKVLGRCYLSEYLRGANGICDLREVV